MSDLSRDYVIRDDGQPTRLPANVSTGLVYRDLTQFPPGCYAAARSVAEVRFPLIPREEWPERIKDMEANKSRLSDIRNRANGGQPIPSYDQNGQGFCWTYSTVGTATLLRAVANLPYVRLSAHSVACKIKDFKDEGGWAALSLDFIAKNGIVPASIWPEKAMDRKYDTPEAWEAAKEFAVTEQWVDFDVAVYDRNFTFDQLATCLLSRIPVACDRYHWSHSTCSMDLVEVDPRRQLSDIRRWGVRDWNSWTDGYGQNGTVVLVGKKAVPDGAVCPRVVIGS